MAYSKQNFQDGQILTAANLEKMENGIIAGQGAHNLLDNSDFSNPIAQAGQNGMHGSTKYVCDRWISWSADATFGNGYITPGSPIDQRFYLSSEQANKTHTAVLYMADGTVKYHVGKPVDSFGTYATVYCGVSDASTNRYFVRIGTEQNVKSVALYEGSYTADTLPAYQPKGYAAELAECQRYYREVYRVFGKDVGNITREAIILNPPMRIPPTSTVKSLWKGNDDTSVTVNSTANDNADVTYTGWGNVRLSLSADL